MASLDAARLYVPPRHRRPDNTTPARLANIARGVLVERADALLCDAVLPGLAERFEGREVDDEVVYDLLIALLAVLFPDDFGDADPDTPDLPPKPHTDVDRQALLDGFTERERRLTIARGHGRDEPAGLVPAGGVVERVGAKQLESLAARLNRAMKPRR